MKEKNFEWLLDSCTPRKGGRLEKGKVYKVEGYPADVVAEWVKTKAAKYVQGGVLKENKE